MLRNPFLYGSPVPPENFCNRQSELQVVFSRLMNCEATAIVGEPNIGKTSLLNYFADTRVQAERLGKHVDQYTFVEIDCGILPANDFKPMDFWQIVFERAQESQLLRDLASHYDLLRQNQYSSSELDKFFRLVAGRDNRIILLLDEFDELLNHLSANRSELLSMLRSLATRTKGLTLVAASRLSVAEMNRESRKIKPHGSPFFGFMIPTFLLPFDDDNAKQLVQDALKRAGDAIKFLADDYAFLFSIAGRQPFLLQVAGASLFDAMAEGKTDDARFAAATELFQRRADAHFDDLWHHHLAPNAQRALLLLALAEFTENTGYIGGRSFNLLALGNLEWFEADLRHLRDLGIVESDAAPGAVCWHNENWRIAAGGIVPWLINNVVARTRDAKDFGEWLRDKEFHGMFTSEEAAKLKEIAGSIPKGAMDTAAEFVRSLFKKGV